jgi:hypothetical protein
LTFFDPVPAELAVRHEALLGAKALKAICFLSHQPYMMTSNKVSDSAYTRIVVVKAAKIQGYMCMK